MDLPLTPVLLLAGCWFLILSAKAEGQLRQNVSGLLADESLLPAKERFRRLIPYMTYYLDQGYNTQNQYNTNPSLQQFQAVQPVSNSVPAQQYYDSQYQQRLVPIGYLVGGGYRQVPVYSRPAQTAYSYTPQNPSDLTQMITQNYLAIAKQMNNLQRPTTQFATKAQNTNVNQQQSQAYKPQTYTRHYQPRYQQNLRRQPYLLKNIRPQYNVPKDDSYVQLHSNYELDYDTSQKNNKYEPDPDVLTITKSQEINFPVEDYQASVQSPISTTSVPILQNSYEESVPIVKTSNQNSLIELLAGYQLSKALPEKVTPSNIGHSIQTLSNILKQLKKVKTHPNYEVSSPDIEGDTFNNGLSQDYSPYQTEGSTPGRAGIDYPAYSEIPETRFDCKNQRYKGFFGDPDTNCQVWHYCDLNGGQASFLCPNGTIFSQVALTCDWWFNVKCASTAQLYVLNERLYKYILPHKPSFPEDFAGPLVDQYLAEKFQELESKKKNVTAEKPSSTLQVLLNDEVNQAVK